MPDGLETRTAVLDRYGTGLKRTAAALQFFFLLDAQRASDRARLRPHSVGAALSAEIVIRRVAKQLQFVLARLRWSLLFLRIGLLHTLGLIGSRIVEAKQLDAHRCLTSRTQVSLASLRSSTADR